MTLTIALGWGWLTATPATAAIPGAAATGLTLAQTGLQAAETAAEAPVAPATYRIGARDQLAVQVYEEPTLSGTFAVNDDGIMDFPLLGPIAITGLTPQDVDDLLTERLAASYLVMPQVNVRVDAFGSQPVQVLGGIDKPGTFYLTGPTTVLDVLTLAGGVTDETAAEVRVKQRASSDDPVIIPLETLVARGEGNLLLQPGDVVFVPPGPVIYITGEVDKPGPIPFRDGVTVTQALNSAGGATNNANLRTVYLLRDGERLRVNVKRILEGRLEDLPLRADDQLFVRESPI